MKYIPVEKLLKNTNGIYKLVVVASMRTLELNEGAPKLVDSNLSKTALIALKEIEEGKISYKEKKE